VDAEGEKIVFGIYKSDGRIMTFPVPDTKSDMLMPLIEKHPGTRSLYYTLDHTAYVSLSTGGRHEVIAHGKEEYARGETNINGIGGFWNYAKTWL
jgi:transposase